MRTRYLKCTYGKGLFSNEYAINFDCEKQNWCFINKTDLIMISDVDEITNPKTLRNLINGSLTIKSL